MHFLQSNQVVVACTSRLTGRGEPKNSVSEMFPKQPKLKSILKRPRDVSPPPARGQRLQTLRSGRAALPSVYDLPCVRSTDKLLGTLEDARCLKRNAEKVLQDLRNFNCQSPGSRAVCVETAHKMLSDVRELHQKYFHEQRVLIERMKVKSDVSAAIDGMFDSLLQEVEKNRSELSNELKVYENRRGRHADSSAGVQELSSRFDQAEDGRLGNRSDDTKKLHELISFERNQGKVPAEDVLGQLEAVDALIESLKWSSEERRRDCHAKKQVMETKRKDLEDILRGIKLDAELSHQTHFGRVRAAVQEGLEKSTELLLAKTLLESLEAKVRAMFRDIEDSGPTRGEKSNTEHFLDRLQNALHILRDVAVPDTYRVRLCMEINQLCGMLTPTPATAVSGTVEDAEVQSLVSGQRLTGAIKSHASMLLERDRSRRSESPKVKSSRKSAKSGGKEGQ